jgi:FkbM family methyltransferase
MSQATDTYGGNGKAQAAPELLFATEQARAKKLDEVIEAVAAMSKVIGTRMDEMNRRLDQMAAQFQAIRRSHAVYLGDDTACTFLHNGWRILVDTRSIDVGIHLIFGGDWETQLTRVFERMLFKGATVLDVGANHGYYTMTAAPIIGREGRVIAFEANPRFAELVYLSLRLNGFSTFAEVHNVAVGDQPGVATLRYEKNFSGGGSITPTRTLQNQTGSQDHREAVNVQMATIDSILGERCSSINVIKMDIEGAEPGAFRGMTKTLQQSRQLRILLEFNGHGPQVVTGFKEMQPLLDAQGFAPFLVEHETLLKATSWEKLYESKAREDIVVCRNDDRSWINFA